MTLVPLRPFTARWLHDAHAARAQHLRARVRGQRARRGRNQPSTTGATMRESWTPTFGACATYTGADCTTPATVRPDWKLPTPPTDEPGAWFPSVYHTGESWLMEWRREDGDDAVEYLMVGDDAWPFVEDWATEQDWWDLGFDVA